MSMGLGSSIHPPPAQTHVTYCEGPLPHCRMFHRAWFRAHSSPRRCWATWWCVREPPPCRRCQWRSWQGGSAETASLQNGCIVLLIKKKVFIIKHYCHIQRALHDELECSLALTHIVPIYTIKLNMANK